jgi:bifunctional UDP-N-acetylglucosamine pyrophosphorylase/glucosamine-1-phosphate N-acetyltransferase
MKERERVALVLAAGKGTRMKSERPKVAHEVAGRAMIAWSVTTALEAGVDRVLVVLGHGRDEIEAILRATFDDRVETVLQAEQRGTGHAVKVALDALPVGTRTLGQGYIDH